MIFFIAIKILEEFIEVYIPHEGSYNIIVCPNITDNIAKHRINSIL